jgi:hypothetical protein
MNRRKGIRTLIAAGILLAACGQTPVELPHYTGNVLNNPEYHHGQLHPALGVHNIQVMRANREQPDSGDGFGWTYNHAPMLAWWKNQFYLEYLSDSVGESVPPGHTLLVTSRDGYRWTRPSVLFPEYRIPDGTVKKGRPDTAYNLLAVMHQRMGFYVSRNDRLLGFGYYGICIGWHDKPNDGLGIGRVVREIREDGSTGPIYFIRYNHGWTRDNTDYPFYTESPDSGFVRACDEVLENPLLLQQWNEESDRDDPLIPMHKEYKALSYYHLPDGQVVGFWKDALTALSGDGGRTWTTPVRAPGFVNANAKIWAQKTSDGRYATVYNPSDFRWPLAISVSEDGLDFHNLLLVNGEITTMRYGGAYKSYGPQYVRGILEGNGTPSDGNLWVSYSMNKEDIWVSCIPVPVREREQEQVSEVYNEMPDGKELDSWNLFSPLWAPARIETDGNGIRRLALKDRDPFDYARADRLFPSSDKIIVEFSVIPAQDSLGKLYIELQDGKGTPAMRILFDSDGNIKHKAGYRLRNIMKYKSGDEYRILIHATTETRFYEIFVNDKKKATGLFYSPVHTLERITFRTGAIRRFPDPDTPTDQDFDVPNGGSWEQESGFYINYLKTSVPDKS